MKVYFTKQVGGVLVPESDLESERMSRFKTGESYEVDIKLSRNPAFHRKAFAFLNFCFEHCDYSEIAENVCPKAQFKMFRSDLTIFAGYYDTCGRLDGSVKAIAKSLSFENMEQEEFEQCYIALTNAAMKHVFHTTDENTFNQLISFF